MGAKTVHFMLGMHGELPKAFPPRRAPYSVYTADDWGNVFAPWSPRQPAPLEIPFTGPLFGPSHANGPSPDCGTVHALKIAMHRAGFGTFISPDGVYSEDLERAVRDDVLRGCPPPARRRTPRRVRAHPAGEGADRR